MNAATVKPGMKPTVIMAFLRRAAITAGTVKFLLDGAGMVCEQLTLFRSGSQFATLAPMNLWHDVPLGENAPDEFNAIVEIPKNSNNKYEVDKETGLIKLDRANYSAAAYPFDYGFAPQTLWEDGDPLDVIVLTTYPL